MLFRAVRGRRAATSVDEFRYEVVQALRNIGQQRANQVAFTALAKKYTAATSDYYNLQLRRLRVLVRRALSWYAFKEKHVWSRSNGRRLFRAVYARRLSRKQRATKV